MNSSLRVRSFYKRKESLVARCLPHLPVTIQTDDDQSDPSQSEPLHALKVLECYTASAKRNCNYIGVVF